MTDQPRHVVLVDDHRLLAQSLAVALRQRGVVATVADLTDPDDLLAQVRAQAPDLVLLDLELGGWLGDGEDLIGRLHETGTRVLVVSATTDETRFGLAVERGAIGVLSKSAPFERLLEMVLAATRGERVLTEADRHALLDRLRESRRTREAAHAPFARLTASEGAVLRSLADGVSVTRIAAVRFVSEATVRSQVRGILVKLGVASQLEAVALARRTGWLSPTPGGARPGSSTRPAATA